MQTQEQAESYSKTTRNVEVTVSPTFLPEQSNIDGGVYAYSYTVRITNNGTQTVQLINRHWIVLSAGRQIADVKGEGVIGEQPVLKAGESHEYSSWTVVQDPIGAMYGTYTFYSDHGEFFDVEIPRFNLLYMENGSVH